MFIPALKKISPQSGFSPALVLVVIGILAVMVGGYLLLGKQMTASVPKEMVASETKKTTALSPEIVTVLEKKTKLIEDLAGNTELIQYVQDSSDKNSALPTEKIKQLDDEWQAAKGNDSFIKPFLTNPTALLLTKFQEDHPEFPEIFVTDKIGLNVGQTNKTSDYYQADEEWWQTAYAGGIGKASHGEIEFDDSAKSESIALYVPLYKNNQAIGVIKAVLSLSGIKREL